VRNLEGYAPRRGETPNIKLLIAQKFGITLEEELEKTYVIDSVLGLRLSFWTTDPYPCGGQLISESLIEIFVS